MDICGCIIVRGGAGPALPAERGGHQDEQRCRLGVRHARLLNLWIRRYDCQEAAYSELLYNEIFYVTVNLE